MTKKKPSKKEIVGALKSEFGIEVDKLDDEIYTKALNNWEQLSLRTIASRCRFYLTGADRDSQKESVEIEGIFMGSRDLVTEKKPLGKNKVQILSFLQKGEDGRFRVFSDPSTPTHFKGFKKDVFGKLVEGKLLISSNDKGTFCTPKDVVVVDDKFELDTSQIEVLDTQGVYDLPEFKECAVIAEISSMWQLRVPEWEADNQEDEDYPVMLKGSPIFQIYCKAEDNEPILRATIHPINLGRPIIAMEDFEVLWKEDADMEEELSPSFSGRKVILIGQKRKNSSYEDREYVDFDINAVLEISGDPVVVKAKAEAVPGKEKSKKKDKIAEKAAKKAKQDKIRQDKVAESVEALRDEATPTIVRSMHDEKFFKGVSDEDLQEMIKDEWNKLGINLTEKEEPGDNPEPEEDLKTPKEEDLFGED